MTRFEGKTVIVTGAAQGIGRAITQRFAAEGASAVLVDVDAGALDATATQLRSLGHQIAVVTGDVSDRNVLADAVQVAEHEFGRVDAAVGVAGVVEIGPLLDITPTGWHRIMSINLDGMWHLTQTVAASMTRSGQGGSITLISSTNAYFPETHTVAYSTSKAAVVGLARAAALDLASAGIRVNAVAPGQILTRLSAVVVDDPVAGPEALARIPLQRWGQPADIAAMCAFLASDDAAYVTGELLTVDGGMTVGVSLGVDSLAIGEHGSASARTAPL